MATLQDYLNRRTATSGTGTTSGSTYTGSPGGLGDPNDPTPWMPRTIDSLGGMTPTSPPLQVAPTSPTGMSDPSTWGRFSGTSTGAGLTSTADRSSRAGLEGAFSGMDSGRTGLTSMPTSGTSTPAGTSSTTTPGSTVPGSTLPMGAGRYPSSTGLPSGGNVSGTQATLPGQAPLPSQYQTNYNPDDPYSTLDYGLGIPKTSITPESVMIDPGFKWQQEQMGRQLEDMFAAKGRVGSTDYFNTLANSQQKMISDEYNRINQQQFDRSMQINKLLYDRRYQENVLGYERQFNENVERYGRERAEEILAYERQFREDARDFDQIRWATELGFQAAGGGSTGA